MDATSDAASRGVLVSAFNSSHLHIPRMVFITRLFLTRLLCSNSHSHRDLIFVVLSMCASTHAGGRALAAARAER